MRRHFAMSIPLMSIERSVPAQNASYRGARELKEEVRGYFALAFLVSCSRGMMSMKEHGRWRVSNWSLRMPYQASLQSPGEPGTQKMYVLPVRPPQARLCTVEVPTFW